MTHDASAANFASDADVAVAVWRFEEQTTGVSEKKITDRERDRRPSSSRAQSTLLYTSGRAFT